MPRPPPPSTSAPSTLTWSGLSACCNAGASPQVILLDDRPPVQMTVEATCQTARLLEVPSTPMKDLRELLSEMGNRQEDLFRNLLENQRELHKQLLGASKANRDAHSASQRRQEDLFAELRDIFCCNSGGVDPPQNLSVGMGQNAIKMNGRVDVPEKAVQSGTGEFVSDISSDTQKDAAETGAENGAHCLVAPSPPVITPDNEATLMTHIESQRLNGRSYPSSSSKSCTPASSQGRPSRMHLSREMTIHVDENKLSSRLNRLLQCKEFELAVAFAILTNAFIMCWECQYQGLEVGFLLDYPGREMKAVVVWPGAHEAFDYLDWTFGLLFLSEMLAKLACWRCGYFYDAKAWDHQGSRLLGWKLACRRCLANAQGWNLLDFFCVAAFLFDKMATGLSFNPQLLRLLRLFRLFRLVRLLRFLETLDHLYIMTTAISGMSKVLTWAIVLLTIMLLTCNLFMVQILQATYFQSVTASDLTEEMLKKHHRMYEYFGTCSRCMLSMFEITLGNWPPIARLLSEEVSQWFGLFCVLHKLTIGFAVIGVITGVILQETFKVAQTDDLIMFRQKKNASRIMRKKMKTLFDSLDSEGDGKLRMSEFVTIGDDPEIKLWLASLDIETDDLATLFALIDDDASGYITLDELVARMPRIKGNARSIDVLALHKKLEEASQFV